MKKVIESGAFNRASLASVDELESSEFRRSIEFLDRFALENHLRPSSHLSKEWEYSWVLKQLNLLERKSFDGKCLNILDIGSELSPIPWVLAERNNVTIVEWSGSDAFPTYARVSESISGVRCLMTQDEHLPFRDEEFDLVTSFSVIEHQPNKALAIDEACRVLRPSGTLGISFDVFHSKELTPSALTLEEFEEIIWFRPEFGNTERPKWNLEDLDGFIQWHRARPAIRLFNSDPRSVFFMDHPGFAYGVGASVLTKR